MLVVFCHHCLQYPKQENQFSFSFLFNKQFNKYSIYHSCLYNHLHFIYTSRSSSDIYSIAYNTLLGKLTCETFTSVVHKIECCLNFYQCVYFMHIYLVNNRSVYLLSITKNLGLSDFMDSWCEWSTPYFTISIINI